MPADTINCNGLPTKRVINPPKRSANAPNPSRETPPLAGIRLSISVLAEPAAKGTKFIRRDGHGAAASVASWRLQDQDTSLSHVNNIWKCPV
ncbi:MAG: hypothetical protein OXI66_08770, partial [Boseongicola sp.]|nr:hypothetical protein [Boseongicola sp.]